MKKSPLLFLLATFLICLFIPNRAAAQYNQGRGNTITCESRRNRLQYCPLSDPNSVVVLVQQLGGAQCVRGETSVERGATTDTASGWTAVAKPSSASSPKVVLPAGGVPVAADVLPAGPGVEPASLRTLILSAIISAVNAEPIFRRFPLTMKSAPFKSTAGCL